MHEKLKSALRSAAKKLPRPITNYFRNQKYVRLALNFDTDRYWKEAIEAIIRYQVTDHSLRNLVHSDMLSMVPNSVPYGYSFTLKSSDFSVVCVHKGLVDEFSIRFVDEFLQTHTLVFANAVFCVYAQLRTITNIDASEYENHAFNFQDWLQSRRKKVELRSATDDGGVKRRAISKILIVTANNFGNVGDDAITHAAHKLISSVLPGASITIANCPIKRDVIDDTDLLVLGGGGLYYDGDIRNAINYTNLMFFANESKIPHIGIGIGTQGIKTDIGKDLFRNALNGASVTIVRDIKDKDHLVNLGVISEIMVSNDIVFSLAPENLPRYTESGRAHKKIGIALLDSHNLLAAKNMKVYQQGIYDSVEYLSRCGYDIVFICQSMDDLPLYKKLSRKYGGEIRRISYEESKRGFDFYQDLDLCITSRFHGLIFSLISDTPVISVGTNGSKTDRLISNKVKSLKHAHIPLKDFNLTNLKVQLEKWTGNPTQFLASREEVSQCRGEALSTAQFVAKSIACK